MYGVSAIVVTWNSRREIVACLRSLERSLCSIPHQIIVVDNCSDDDTCALVSNSFPSVFLIRSPRNMGFGAGNNMGIRYAKGNRILLINPDTIANARAIRTLWDFLDHHPRVGVVGPEQTNAFGRSLFTTSKLTIVGVCIFLLEDVIWRMTGRSRLLSPSVVRVRRLNAGCIMARRGVLGKTHRWFDPELFLYGEEFSFFPRVRAAGWEVYLLRHVSIIHHRDRSINQSGGRLLHAWQSFPRVLASRIADAMFSRA